MIRMTLWSYTTLTDSAGEERREDLPFVQEARMDHVTVR